MPAPARCDCGIVAVFSCRTVPRMLLTIAVFIAASEVCACVASGNSVMPSTSVAVIVIAVVMPSRSMRRVNTAGLAGMAIT